MTEIQELQYSSSSRLWQKHKISGTSPQNRQKKGKELLSIYLCIDSKKQNEMVKQIGRLDEEIKKHTKVQLLKGYFITL